MNRRGISPRSHHTTNIAYEQAAHAVMSVTLRLPVGDMTVLPVQSSESPAENGDRAAAVYEQALRRLQIAEKEIIANFTEPMARDKRLGQPCEIPMPHHDDEDGAALDSGLVCGGNRSRQAYLQWLWETAEDHLEIPWLWRAVIIVAETLLEKQKLTADEVAALTKEAARGWIESGLQASINEGSAHSSLHHDAPP